MDKQITIRGKDVIFHGFLNENREATKEEAKSFLNNFYHEAKRRIEE